MNKTDEKREIKTKRELDTKMRRREKNPSQQAEL